MSEIHYFPRYSQKENVVTNNTLLLLLRLNQYNRFKFEKFMELLCDDLEVPLASSWLQFRQQKGTGKSVVDGYISQESIKIAVETKLGDEFDQEQLENHLKIFGTEQHKLLILLSPSLGENSNRYVKMVREKALKQNIQLVHTSFEDIIQKTNACLSDHDEEMKALVDDFELFCSDMDLLPRDEYTMFVPPCGESYEENEKFSLYYCPATRNHRKAKYLGIYKDKMVRSIGRIVKVVTCDVNINAKTVKLVDGGEKLTKEEEKRIIGATRSAQDHDWDLSSGHKFFLFDALEKTEFKKLSAGGMWRHRYFDLENILGTKKMPNNVKELATLLRDKTWE